MTFSNDLSPTSQATLLLTSYFSKSSDERVKPLTNKEWGKFALWLKDKKLSPRDLLNGNPAAQLEGWNDPKISVERIVQLLERGHSLALAIEKWQRAGLWVVTRSDPEYPRRLKHHLKIDSPPVLFGCGDKSLLNAGGLAVVGSRKAVAEDLLFTQRVGEQAALEGVAIVSGGARGVDETAMLGAVNRGGVVIGILADSLLRAATSAKWRPGLMNNNLVLVSPFYPEAGFFAGNAMARNKYIYCLADAALVVHSGTTGGTLSGAEENLKKSWVPLWVKRTNDTTAANADLVMKGGNWLPDDIDKLSINELVAEPTASESFANAEQLEQMSFFHAQDELFAEQSVEQAPESADEEIETPTSQSKIEEVRKPVVHQTKPADFYQIFLSELKRAAKREITTDEIVEHTDLHKSQVSEWLKRATAEGAVKKLSRPVRYKVLDIG